MKLERGKIVVIIFYVILCLGLGTGSLQAQTKNSNIIFLHHSTGQCIWDGGVNEWFDAYNTDNNTNHQIIEQEFPKDDPYGWENYPYDYYNIWVKNAGQEPYRQEPTLEILTKKYDIIVLKHCFPVGYVDEDYNDPDIDSSEKRMENYELQYNALKEKMVLFPDNKFIVWTGAALVKNDTSSEQAQRTKDFFNWVKNDWDKPQDYIFIFDFYQLQTEGELYFKRKYSQGSDDSHPNESFSKRVAPYFCQRIIDVISERGDTADETGK